MKRKLTKSTSAKGIAMKSYTFKVRIEEDTFPDGSIGYFVSVPALEHLGAATQGKTPEEALRSIQEVLEMVLEEPRTTNLITTNSSRHPR